MPFAAMRWSKRWRIRARAWWPRTRRSPNWCAPSRIAAKQIDAELGVLNNMLALPSDQRDDTTVRAINAEIEKLRAERKAAQLEIKRRFPSYADLVDPKPPTVDEIKATLRPGEALLSFYFGQDASFVWAVPKDGAVAFAAVAATAIELEAKVRRLRQALEPQVATIDELPPFDLTLAYELYTLLLKPVEAGWQAGQEPDRGDQRRVGRTAAQSVADRAVANRCQCHSRYLPAIAACRGWHGPMR